jgi:ATP-dependent RNA helicase RhlE
MLFEHLSLSEQIIKSLKEEGYKTPTAIQLKVIPAVLEGQDVMAAAQTGTGKTAGFTLPMLDKLSQGEKTKPFSIRALILTPTRELAAQVQDSVKTYGKYLSVTSTCVFGGVKIGPQMKRLSQGVDILVATPGRLLDLMQQRAVYFDQLEMLVLDEADRMLDMGFINDIKKVIAKLPKKRQNLMFSATFSAEIRTLAKGLMHNAVEISVTPPNTTVSAIKQWVHPVDKKNKNKLLSHLIWEGRWEQVLVFARTKHGANRLAEFLCEDGLSAVAIHGNKSQGARTRALQDFKNGEARVLVATDIAARGLDIELLPHVVNFDLPQVPEDYIHRIGRTGRAGATGEAISLVSADEFRLLADIEKLIKQKLPREEIEKFSPKHALPEARTENAHREPRRNQTKENDRRYESRDRKPSSDRRSQARKSEWSDRKEYSAKPARVDRADMPRIQKAERFERVSKQEWPAKGRKAAPTRSGRPASSDRPARKEWAPREDRFAKSDRADRPARFDRTEKKEWAPRADRPEKRSFANKSEGFKSARPARKEWAPREDRFAKSDRSDRPARFDRTEKKEWKPREDRFSKSDRSERPARFERTEKKEWAPRADRPEKRSFANKSEGFKSARPARKEWAPKDDAFEKKDRRGKPSSFKAGDKKKVFKTTSRPPKKR